MAVSLESLSLKVCYYKVQNVYDTCTYSFECLFSLELSFFFYFLVLSVLFKMNLTSVFSRENGSD